MAVFLPQPNPPPGVIQPEPTTSTTPTTPIQSASGSPVTVGYTYDEQGNPIPITYTPPEVAKQQPSSTVVNTSIPSLTIPINQYNPNNPALSEAIANHNLELNNFNVQKQAFDNKWNPIIVDNKFTGTQDQYRQYLQEVSNLNNTAMIINNRAELLNKSQSEITQNEQERQRILALLTVTGQDENGNNLYDIGSYLRSHGNSDYAVSELAKVFPRDKILQIQQSIGAINAGVGILENKALNIGEVKTSPTIGQDLTNFFISRYVKKTPTQSELRELYSRQQSDSGLQKILTSRVLYDEKQDKYYIPTTTEAPFIGSFASLSAKEIATALATFLAATGALVTYENRDQIQEQVQQFKDQFNRNPTANEISIQPASNGEPAKFVMSPLQNPTVETFPLAEEAGVKLTTFPLAQEEPSIKADLTPTNLGKVIKEDLTPTNLNMHPADLRPMPLDKPTIMISQTVTREIPTTSTDWDKALDNIRNEVVRETELGRVRSNEQAVGYKNSEQYIYSPSYLREKYSNIPNAAKGISAASILLLDQKIADLYSTGQLTDSDVSNYKEARLRYMNLAGIDEDTVKQISDSPQLQDYTQIALSILTSAIPALSEQTLINTQAQSQEATKVNEGLSQETQTQSQTNERTSAKEATKLQEATQEQTSSRTAVRELTKTAEQVRAKEAEITRPAENVAEAEMTMPLELTATQSLTGIRGLKFEPGNTNIPSDNKEYPPITWHQRNAWYTIYYNQKVGKYNILKATKNPPSGATVARGVGSAYKTIQSLGKNSDVLLTIDMGIEDVIIDSPSRKAGKSGAIRFKKDKNQSTTSDLTARGVKLT